MQLVAPSTLPPPRTCPLVEGQQKPYLTSQYTSGADMRPCKEVGLTGLVSWVVQAFQVSDQAVKLWKEGWFQPQDAHCGESKLRNPKVWPPQLVETVLVL